MAQRFRDQRASKGGRRIAWVVAAQLGACSLASVLALGTMAMAQSAQSASFNIAPQPLPTALAAFYQQSGLQLLYDGAIAEERNSPAGPAGADH